MFVRAARQPDGAHPAAAKLAHQLIRADATARLVRRRRLRVREPDRLRDDVELVRGLIEERLNFGAKFRVVPARFVEERDALLRVVLESSGESSLDLLP